MKPLYRKGNSQGKTAFPTLAEGLAHARAALPKQLTAAGEALGLTETQLETSEEIIEDQADFSSRTRKELVIARLEPILKGMPG